MTSVAQDDRDTSIGNFFKELTKLLLVVTPLIKSAVEHELDRQRKLK